MDDGSTVWLEFSGKNGRGTRASARLARLGRARRGPGHDAGHPQWFNDHPDRYDEIVDQDASYVFFKESRSPARSARNRPC